MATALHAVSSVVWLAAFGLSVIACGAGDLTDTSHHEHAVSDDATALASFAHDLNDLSDPLAARNDRAITPWPSAQISYAVEPLPGFIDHGHFHLELRRGLDEWERATLHRRVFFRIENVRDAQLVFGFQSPDHHDSCDRGFSTRAHTIAHAFTFDVPCKAGVVHLNAHLRWVLNGSHRKGTYDVRYAVMHEVGHLLGLGHIDEPGHIMHPEYGGVFRQLSNKESADVLEALERNEE
jgi:hypothetical protein